MPKLEPRADAFDAELQDINTAEQQLVSDKLLSSLGKCAPVAAKA